MILSEEQTRLVADYLRSLGRLKRSTHHEVLDHLCCDIEYAMAGGLSFQDAFAACQTRWNENEVKTIHSSTKKHLPMVKLMSLLAFGLSFFLLSGPNEEAVTSANTHNAEHLPCALRADGFPTAIRIAPPTVCPLQNQFKVTSGFGQTVHPITKADRFHEGMDFSAPLGTPVLAGGDGVVVEAGDFGNYGLRVIIAHDEIYQTLYAHLSVIDVKVGQTIKAGDTIGKVGNTGVSTGPHLHYEVHKNGSKVDPKAYIPSC